MFTQGLIMNGNFTRGKNMETNFNIINLFSDDELIEKADGNFKTKCPSCGSEGLNDYGGLVIFPKTNTSYCHAAGKWFNFKETYALIKGYISCIEGRTADE